MQTDRYLLTCTRYIELGPVRQDAYRQLFASHINETGLGLIRRAANQELVLGFERFEAMSSR